MELVNEYLAIIDKNTSHGLHTLCTSTDMFNKLLIGKNLEIKKNKILSNEIVCEYFIKIGNVKDKKQNFFYLKFIFDNNNNKIDNFNSLMRLVKYTLEKHDIYIETLRDDLTFYYSQMAYSKIHKIENLMRKFITYIMITNEGRGWITESSPKEIKEIIKNSNKNNLMSDLQKLDFIHLGDLLFKPHEKDLSILFNLIKTPTNLKIDSLVEYIPQSNWDKYFKKIVDCDDKFLKDRWKELYKLRNLIAHTSSFSKDDYLSIVNLTNEVEDKLNKAFDHIDNVELEAGDKEQLSENIATNINEDLGRFLKEWSEFQDTIKYIYKINSNDRLKFLDVLKKVLKRDFDETTLNEIDLIAKYRNNLIHNFNNEERNSISKNIEKIRKILYSTWKIQVLKAFHELAGEAELKDIYQNIKNSLGKILTPSDEAAIRKVIYYHSSDVELFQGKEDLFEKLGNGKWKLRTKNPAQ